MNKENIPVITDREELYDKCENMEQLFDKYYLPLLYKHYSKVYELQQENNQLKEQLEKEKEVKSKAIGHVNACGGELTKDECKYLLQILDTDKGE